MKFIRILYCLLLWLPGALTVSAQTEGDIWVTGYAQSIPEEDFGITYWNFEHGYPVIEYNINHFFFINETNASISSQGEVLLITNGMQIQTPDQKSVIDTIAYLDGGENWTANFLEGANAPFGFPKIQTAIILPVPDHPDEYSVIYYHGVTHPVILFFGVVAVLEARVHKMSDGSWEVLYKDKVILENYEFLSQGTWHACRHANGRDWWLLIHDLEGINYYQLLLDPSSLHYVGTQVMEAEVLNVNPNAWFSPDGTKYAKYASTTLQENVLYIYDFNRCSGLLSNRVKIRVTGELMTYQGIAFSTNIRYLFAGVDAWELYQYDLWAPDIEASRMLVDTNDGYVEPNWFPATFGPMMPGPDGRIYMFPKSGSSRAVHVIDRPDERGKASKLLQHHIMLQTSNGKSVQNFANFRLGPLDGSSCDTLGIDNHPVSWWRHEVEDVDPLEIRFTDLSYFRPEVWEWDFGDGDVSNDQNPLHTYPSPGLYYACLTVSNEYSADSSCHWIEIESVSTEEVGQAEEFIVHPNPFTDYVEITPPDGYNRYRTLHVTIIDIHGRVIASPEMTCPCRLKLGSIPSGVYFYTLEENGQPVGSGKVVKM